MAKAPDLVGRDSTATEANTKYVGDITYLPLDGGKFLYAALGDERLLAPIGMGPGGWADETYLKLALHALKEVTHHGGEIGLLRDLYLREGV